MAQRLLWFQRITHTPSAGPMEDRTMKRDWLNETDAAGMSPLMRASKSGRSEVLTMMLVRDVEDQPANFRELPTLHRAACWGYADVIVELLDEGFDPDEPDAQGETPLHKAVRLDNVEAAEALIENGANVNAADALGMTALHWASMTGNAEMAELLLRHYADIDARDYCAGGVTPKGIARMLGHREIVEMMQNRFALV